MKHLNNDICLQSYKRTQRQALKPLDCKKRMSRSKGMLNKIKKKPREVVIVLSDETPLQLGEIVASDTGFCLAEVSGAADVDVKHIGKERHYARMQILAVVGSDGRG